MTGHSPWKTGFYLRRVNVRIVAGKVTMECAFIRVIFILFNNIPSVLNAHSHIPDVM